MSPAVEAKPGRERFAFLYAVRGYAILGVMLVHIGQRVQDFLPWVPAQLARQGQLAVGVFFMLSMAGLTLSYRSCRSNSTRPLLTLAARRFVHLAPLFWVVIAINLALYGFGSRFWAPDGISVWTVVLTALCLHGWHPNTFNSVVSGGWYLAVDAMMLLSLPILLRKTYSPKRILLISGLTALAGAVLNLLVYNWLAPSRPPHLMNQLYGFLFCWFPNQLCVIVLGTALFPVARMMMLPGRRAPGFRETAMVVGCLVAVVGILMLPAFPFLPIHYVVQLLFFVMIAAMARHNNMFLITRPMAHLGKLSYPLFLTHFLVLDFVIAFLKAVYPALRSHPKGYTLSIVVGTLAMSYLVAVASHQLLERPSLRLGGYITTRLHQWQTRRGSVRQRTADLGESDSR